MTTTNIDRPILTKSWATSARTAALVFAAVLIAAPLLAQRHAQPRSGGSGGGGGMSGGGHRSAGPSASAPSSRGGGGGGGSWDGGGHRPPGSGGGAPHRPPGFDRDHGHGHGGHHGHSYYYPYYYPSYGFSFGFGYGYPYYSGYYGYPYSYGGYYPYYYGYRPYYYGYRPYYYPPAYSYGYNYGEGAGYVPAGEAASYYDRASLGAVAVKVKPKSAEVYVDGNYVGAAGSFDGFPTYLWIPPGDHRIEVVQVGYANLTAQVEVGSGQVVELDSNLQRGESVRPAPPSNRYAPRDGERAPYRDDERAPYREGERAPYPENDYRAAPPLEQREPAEDNRERRFESADLGGLFLEVRPDDASVYLDGRFVGTGRDVSTATEPLRLVPGEHRLQVIHPDYPNQEQSVEIGAGEEKRVEVTLRRGAGI